MFFDVASSPCPTGPFVLFKRALRIFKAGHERVSQRVPSGGLRSEQLRVE
jgi:hypothetical protein